MSTPTDSEGLNTTLPQDVVDDIELTVNTWIDALSFEAGKPLKTDIRQRFFLAVVRDVSQRVQKDAIDSGEPKITFLNVCNVKKEAVINMLKIFPTILEEMNPELPAS